MKILGNLKISKISIIGQLVSKVKGVLYSSTITSKYDNIHVGGVKISGSTIEGYIHYDNTAEDRPPLEHTHNDLYYTESQANTRYMLKSSANIVTGSYPLVFYRMALPSTIPTVGNRVISKEGFASVHNPLTVTTITSSGQISANNSNVIYVIPNSVTANDIYVIVAPSPSTPEVIFRIVNVSANCTVTLDFSGTINICGSAYPHVYLSPYAGLASFYGRYNNGMYWNNISDKDHLICKTLGFFACGYNGSVYSNTLEWIDTTTYITNNTGMPLFYGSVSSGTGISDAAGISGPQYGFICGGFRGTAVNTAYYFDLTIIGSSASARNSQPNAMYGQTGISGPCYGHLCGGYYSGVVTTSYYFDILTTNGNIATRTSISAARACAAGISGPQYGFICGGVINDGSASYVVDVIDLTIFTGNTGSTQSTLTCKGGGAGVSGPTYGFIGGGNRTTGTNVIQMLNITTTTISLSSKGTLTQSRHSLTGVSGPQYGFFAGGVQGTYFNTIDFIDLTTNVTWIGDRGDLTAARSGLCGFNS